MTYQRTVAVPFTQCEWAKVQSMFLSRNKNETSECASILTMWINRMGKDTPVAIHCSQILIMAVLSELEAEELDDEKKWRAINELKWKHGHGVARFMNYVNEMGQTRDHLLNMVAAVSPFGIPKWMVEVRHAITHQDMPDLDVLRKATDFAIEWLWKEFWFKDANHAIQNGKSGAIIVEDFGATSQKEEEYLKAIEQYMKFRYRNRQDIDLDKSDYVELIRIKQFMVNDPIGFLCVLASDGCIIQNNQQLKASKTVTSGDDSFKISAQQQEFWQPIIQMMFDVGTIVEFIMSLLFRLKETRIEISSQHQVIAYVRDAITETCNTSIISERDWQKILDSMLSVASFFCRDLMELIITKLPNISRMRRNQIRKILDIQLSVSALNIDDSETVKTVEDLQNLLKKDHKQSAAPVESNLAIELCDPEQWINISFGLSHGQQSDTFSLIIDDDYLEKLNRKRKILS